MPPPFKRFGEAGCDVVPTGPELPVAVLPRTNQIVLLQMDSKIPVELFDDVCPPPPNLPSVCVGQGGE